jgi:uncharacterized membrane protein YebE (DUF533 family)
MFDARSLLDALVRGGAQPQAGQGEYSAISDMLKQLGGGQSVRPDAIPQPRAAGADDVNRDIAPSERMPPRREDGDDAQRLGAQGGGSLEDLLRSAFSGQGGGGLGDILGKLQQGGGGIADILGQVLGQAGSGVKEGAGRLDQATGASDRAREAMRNMTGRSPEDILAQLKEMVANNQLGTGAALGGLGSLILGTGTGRSLAGSAIKLGSLALIGGLAYKAYQNYQQGQPPLTGGKAVGQPLAAAPAGSGFEASTVNNEQATLLIRAMIAAAAADGRIDDKEQQKILGGLKQAGLESAAQKFLTQEINNPATVDELADAVTSTEEGVQIYTAARIAVDPDIEEEHEFLVALAERLGIDEGLADHIDAAARGAGA